MQNINEILEELNKNSDWSYYYRPAHSTVDAYFYVLESVNTDPDSEDHYDGDFAKTYKREGKV